MFKLVAIVDVVVVSITWLIFFLLCLTLNYIYSEMFLALSFLLLRSSVAVEILKKVRGIS